MKRCKRERESFAFLVLEFFFYRQQRRKRHVDDCATQRRELVDATTRYGRMVLYGTTTKAEAVEANLLARSRKRSFRCIKSDTQQMVSSERQMLPFLTVR